MLPTDQVSAIFADARVVHADALRLLEADDVPIPARTGVRPEFLWTLRGDSSRWAKMSARVSLLIRR